MNKLSLLAKLAIVIMVCSCSLGGMSHNDTLLPFVEIKGSTSNVILEILNPSDKSFYLFKYIFCSEEVLFEDVFRIYELDGGESEKLEYGGVVDFYGSANSIDDFLRVEPKSSLVCEIDLVNYYNFEEGRDYVVEYRAVNPEWRRQSSFVLTSKKLK